METSLKRRLGIGAGVLSLVIGGLTVAATGTAEAVTCTHPAYSNKDKTGYGRTTSDSPIRTGPAESCAALNTAKPGNRLDYWCYASNSIGNTWTYVSIGSVEGWVYDGNLNDNGSSVAC